MASSTLASLSRMPTSRRVRLWMLIVLVVVIGLSVLQFMPGWEVPARETLGLPLMTVLSIFLAALACEYMDSSLGMGYGTTLAPLLMLSGFEPLQIVPAVLISELVTGVSAGLLHQCDGNVDFLGDARAPHHSATRQLERNRRALGRVAGGHGLEILAWYGHHGDHPVHGRHHPADA